MSTRRLWVIYLAATVATVVAPVVAEWAQHRLNAPQPPPDDTEPDQADPIDLVRDGTWADLSTEECRQRWHDMWKRAESDSDGLSEPAAA